jgi:biopolymer transport protein ExbB/TolQ
MVNRAGLVPEHPFRTILLWLAWAATAVIVYFLLYLDTNLWQHVLEDQSRVAVVILVMFLMGAALSFNLVVALTRESKQALRLGTVVREQGLAEVDPRRGRFAVQRFFAMLKTVIASNTLPDIDTMIDVELDRYQRRSDAVGVIGNLLITLGLIGTVIGLTFTLTGLTTALDSLQENHQDLIRGLEQAMSGMGTAFYTTLLGSVLGGVLLRIFSLITSHGISDLSDTLKRICIFCTRDIGPSAERDMRLLNEEVLVLSDNCRLLRAALDDTRTAMLAFRETASELHGLGTAEDGKEKTLRDSVMLQMYYSDLLREEMKLISRINRSWWSRLVHALRRPRRGGGKPS